MLLGLGPPFPWNQVPVLERRASRCAFRHLDPRPGVTVGFGRRAPLPVHTLPPPAHRGRTAMTTVADLKGQTVAFAASGGLDSCTVTRWLTENGVKVVCFTADIAQPDEANFDAIETRMRACGAADYVAIP